MDCAGVPQPRLLVDGGSVGRQLDCGLCLQFYGNYGKKFEGSQDQFFFCCFWSCWWGKGRSKLSDPCHPGQATPPPYRALTLGF